MKIPSGADAFDQMLLDMGIPREVIKVIMLGVQGSVYCGVTSAALKYGDPVKSLRYLTDPVNREKVCDVRDAYKKCGIPERLYPQAEMVITEHTGSYNELVIKPLIRQYQVVRSNSMLRELIARYGTPERMKRDLSGLVRYAREHDVPDLRQLGRDVADYYVKSEETGTAAFRDDNSEMNEFMRVIPEIWDEEIKAARVRLAGGSK